MAGPMILTAFLALAALCVAMAALGSAREARRVANLAYAQAAADREENARLKARLTHQPEPDLPPVRTRPTLTPATPRGSYIDPDQLAAETSGTVEDLFAEAGPAPTEPEWHDPR